MIALTVAAIIAFALVVGLLVARMPREPRPRSVAEEQRLRTLLADQDRVWAPRWDADAARQERERAPR